MMLGAMMVAFTPVIMRCQTHDMEQREEIAILLVPLQAQAHILRKKIYPA